MPTPEEKYYDAMNTLLAPVRWVKSLIQTVLLLAIAIVIGLAYPVILWLNGDPVTAGSFLISFDTLLAVFTLFYAPYYFMVGGVALIVTLAGLTNSNPDSPFYALRPSEPGYGFEYLVLAFLVVGILQRYIRHRLFDPPNEPKEKRLNFVEQLNQVRRERRTYEYNAMSMKQREAMIRHYGDDYLTWPEMGCPGPREAISNDTADDSATKPESLDESDAHPSNSADEHNELSKHYAMLGVRNGADPQEVKQAYRDLTKVWHPDRLADADTRLRQKAEEQLKAINFAYEQIQEAQSHRPQQSDASLKEIPL